MILKISEVFVLLRFKILIVCQLGHALLVALRHQVFLHKLALVKNDLEASIVSLFEELLVLLLLFLVKLTHGEDVLERYAELGLVLFFSLDLMERVLIILKLLRDILVVVTQTLLVQLEESQVLAETPVGDLEHLPNYLLSLWHFWLGWLPVHGVARYHEVFGPNSVGLVAILCCHVLVLKAWLLAKYDVLLVDPLVSARHTHLWHEVNGVVHKLAKVVLVTIVVQSITVKVIIAIDVLLVQYNVSL